MKIVAEYESDIDVHIHTVLDVNLLIRLLQVEGVTAESVLSGSGLSLEQVSDQATLISFRQKLAIFQNVLQLTKRPSIGLYAGSHARFSDFGMFGYAVISSATLGDAIELGFKYLKLAGPVLRKCVTVEGDNGLFEGFDVIDLGDLLPFCTEFWFSSINALCSDAMGRPFVSTGIKLPYKKPEYIEEYEKIFNCPIEFNTAVIEWRFDASELSQPVPSANPITVNMCMKTCDDMLQLISQPSDIGQRISQILLESAGRFPGIEKISQEIGMSSRSLRRRLKELDTSYQKILDNTRQAIAIEYLRTTELTVEEIAIRTGFTEASNFRHAFRRWSGKTPAEVRLETD